MLRLRARPVVSCSLSEVANLSRWMFRKSRGRGDAMSFKGTLADLQSFQDPAVLSRTRVGVIWLGKCMRHDDTSSSRTAQGSTNLPVPLPRLICTFVLNTRRKPLIVFTNYNGTKPSQVNIVPMFKICKCWVLARKERRCL